MALRIQESSRPEIIRIVAVYSLFGGLWIYLSDTFIGMVFTDPVVLSRMSMYKGLVFIALTAALLYVLIVRYINRINVHIHDLNQAQVTLLRQKSLLDIVIEGTDDAVYLKDAAGRYLFANSAVARFVGKPLADIIGRDDAELFPTEEAHALMDHDRWVMSQGAPQTFEELLTTPEGGRYFLSTKGPMQGSDGGVTGIFGIARDISERKQAEDALAKSEQLFRSFVENVNDVLFVLTPSGVFSYVSPQWKDAFGYELSETVGKPFLPFVHPDDVPGCMTFLQQVLESGKKQSGVEYRVLCTDGSYVWYRANGSQTIDPLTGIPSFVGIGRDISDLKRAEEEKRAFEQQYQQTQKLESLGVLAGGIAHDFNNILAIIIGRCSLAKMRQETAVEHIESIEKAAERAAELCRQMLAYAGKAQFTLSQINMRWLVDEMVNMLRTTTNQNAVIVFDSIPDIPFIKGDASQLRQVVMNLIINASEAIGMEQGEIRVNLATIAIKADEPIKDHLGAIIASGEYIRLEVTDSGCGMDSETKRRIFEPFYSTKFTGRGLGMSAVLGIITAHKGALQLFSQPGQGTTFLVYLPVQANNSLGKEPYQRLPQAQWLGSGTILLVDDEEQILIIAKTMLVALGFTVITAANGREALAKYREHASEIVLVLTDVGMPVMDGYMLFRELKSINPDLPIVISSGFGEADVTARIARENIAGLVGKPFNSIQLRDVIQNVVMHKANTAVHAAATPYSAGVNRS